MRTFQEIISYIFHPIFAPILGTLTYFAITPKYTPLSLQSGNILPIFILTIIIPIIAFYILRNIGLANNFFYPTITERKYILYINISLLLMIIYKVIPYNYISELYYFFIGLICAYFSALLLLLLKFKSSMHIISIGSILMYIISLSVHFEINILIFICIIIITTGLVTSSRIYLKAHSKAEIIVGLILGITSQLLTIKYWV